LRQFFAENVGKEKHGAHSGAKSSLFFGTQFAPRYANLATGASFFNIKSRNEK
jgi:hypothetical protein